MNIKKLLNSKKKKGRRFVKRRKHASTGWLSINIDLSDAIKVDWDLIDKPKRVVNSGKK